MGIEEDGGGEGKVGEKNEEGKRACVFKLGIWEGIRMVYKEG